MTCQKAQATPYTVTGMLSIYDTDVYVLIDSGYTYSYIACSLASRLGLRLDTLDQSIIVSTLVGTIIVINGVYRVAK